MKHIYRQYSKITHALLDRLDSVYICLTNTNRSRKDFITLAISQTSGMIELATSRH